MVNATRNMNRSYQRAAGLCEKLDDWVDYHWLKVDGKDLSIDQLRPLVILHSLCTIIGGNMDNYVLQIKNECVRKRYEQIIKLERLGYRHKEIARAINCSPSRVGELKRRFERYAKRTDHKLKCTQKFIPETTPKEFHYNEL